jgi:hypothetical protein
MQTKANDTNLLFIWGCLHIYKRNYTVIIYTITPVMSILKSQ